MSRSDEAGTLTAQLHALKILFITLEFRTGTFSGNGVYATAQVRALAAAGHRVFVISAAPTHAKHPKDDFGVACLHEVPVSSWHRLDAGAPWREFAAGVMEEGVTAAVAPFAPDVVLAVDWSALPAVRNLAPYCGGAPYVYLNYRVFTRTAVGQDLDLVRGLEAAAMSESVLTVALSRSDAHYLADHVAPHQPRHHHQSSLPLRHDGNRPEGLQAEGKVIMKEDDEGTSQPGCGDDGGGNRHRQCPAAASATGAARRRQAQQGPVAAGAAPYDTPTAEAHVYTSRQGEGPGSRHGAGAGGHGPDPSLSLTAEPRGIAGAAPAAAWRPPIPKVLLPALRDDVRQLEPPAELVVPGSCGEAGATEAAAWAAARPYLSCVVRLSPEKEPERFVALVESMAARGLLERHGLTPLLLGAANDEFAQGLKSRLRAAAPSSVILESFMGPAELAELYRRTRLNVHPSTYDAYGMTIVEAASQGAPSVVHDGNGAVGATDLMRGREGEVVLLDLTALPEWLAVAVSAVLEDTVTLAATSSRAMRRARSWDEAANAAELIRLVREAMTQRAAAR